MLVDYLARGAMQHEMLSNMYQSGKQRDIPTWDGEQHHYQSEETKRCVTSTVYTLGGSLLRAAGKSTIDHVPVENGDCPDCGYLEDTSRIFEDIIIPRIGWKKWQKVTYDHMIRHIGEQTCSIKSMIVISYHCYHSKVMSKTGLRLGMPD